jgi:hypothetical protein
VARALTTEVAALVRLDLKAINTSHRGGLGS